MNIVKLALDDDDDKTEVKKNTEKVCKRYSNFEPEKTQDDQHWSIGQVSYKKCFKISQKIKSFCY